MELRQQLKDDVVAREAGREVEGEVRPEAVRVREHGALRPARRPRRVDEQQPVVVLDLRRDRPGSVGRRRQRLALPAGRRGERCMLVLDQEQARLGVVELEAKLGRRQPPVQRDEREGRLRAGEEDDHVLRRVARQRRDAVAAAKPALEQIRGESVRPPVELPVCHLAAEVVDCDAVRRPPRRVAEPAAEGVQAHAANSSTSEANSRGRSHGRRCPAPSKSWSRAPPIASAMSVALRTSTTLSAVPWTTSVGTPISPTRAAASCAAPALASAYQPAGSGGCARRYATISSTSAAGASGARALSTNRRCATSGSSCGALPISATVCAGIGNAAAPPGAVEQST